MKKIYFRNDESWNKLKAVMLKKSVNTKGIATLKNKDSSDSYELDFDDDKFDCLYFKSSFLRKTSKVFPGNLSVGIEYKYCDKKGEHLTYLFSKQIIKTGRVESYALKDTVNLSYRDDKSKKICVFIPESYDGTVPYDILYFFDAQNLFCNAGEYTENGDPYGSWQLDIVLSEIYRQYGKKIIVVGIDNADMYRSQELFMNPAEFGELSVLGKNTPNENFSVGYLDSLSSFMVSTLHNFIKEKYNIDENNIGIGGSSMGGIAAFYCGLREMGFYKYVLSYSPAYGLYKMSAFKNYFNKLGFDKRQGSLPRIHIYCGGGDPLERMLLPSAKKMKSLLVNCGYKPDLIFETYDFKKPHNEESWRLILPESFSLLLNL